MKDSKGAEVDLTEFVTPKGEDEETDAESADEQAEQESAAEDK